jgi:hypothetical protein
MLEWNKSQLGAGPGITRTYYVDLPFPWGDDTPVTLPMQQMVQDVIFEARLQIPEVSREVAEVVLPIAVDRVNREIPNWTRALIAQAQPAAEKKIDEVSRRVYFLTALLVGGLGYVAWKVS